MLVAEPCEEETGEYGHAPLRNREVGLLLFGARHIKDPAALLEQRRRCTFVTPDGCDVGLAHQGIQHPERRLVADPKRLVRKIIGNGQAGTLVPEGDRRSASNPHTRRVIF